MKTFIKGIRKYIDQPFNILDAKLASMLKRRTLWSIRFQREKLMNNGFFDNVLAPADLE